MTCMHILHLNLTIMLFVGVLIAQGSVSASVYIVNYTGLTQHTDSEEQEFVRLLKRELTCVALT